MKQKIKDMSKTKKAILGLLVTIIIVKIGIHVFAYHTDTRGLGNGTVTFDCGYDASVVDKQLNKFEEIIIKAMFSGKILYEDSPSCGFSENVAISFREQEQAFLIARDTCSVIYDKKENCYFRIWPWEKAILYVILGRYGFEFPCV